VTSCRNDSDCHKNNVFRLLATLEHRGYIEQNKETENYRLGPKTLQIVRSSSSSANAGGRRGRSLKASWRPPEKPPWLRSLRATKVITWMAWIRTVRSAPYRGSAMLPAHCTAVGKVQLAFLPASEIERLYPEQGHRTGDAENLADPGRAPR